MSPPIYTPDGSEVSEIVLPDGSTASEVIDPDGNVVFEAGPDIPDSVLAQDLVAWWRMGDDDGDALIDSANTSDFADATQYDLTEQGQSTQESNTLPSGGVTDPIEGANSSAYDMIPDGNLKSSLTDLTAPFTFMGWVNFDSFPQNNISLFGDWNSTSDDFYINYAEETNEFKLSDDSSDILDASLSVTTGEWYHVAGVLASLNRIFINGVEEANGFAAGSNTFSGGDGFHIGSLNNSIQFSDAQFDDVRVYNRELTASEISDIYNATKP